MGPLIPNPLLPADFLLNSLDFAGWMQYPVDSVVGKVFLAGQIKALSILVAPMGISS